MPKRERWTVHSQIEEELFYPEVREAIDAMDIMDEAEVEHTLAKQLVQELKAMQQMIPYTVRSLPCWASMWRITLRKNKTRCSQRSKRPRWISVP